MILLATINIGLLLGVVYLVYRQLIPRLHPLFFLLALAIKLIAGVALGLLYLYYYEEGDTFQFHAYASEQVEIFYQDPSAFIHNFFESPPEQFVKSPRAWLMAKVTSLFYIMTGGSYWLSASWMSVVSFIGFYYAGSKITAIWPDQKRAVTIAFLFIPSIVFWSSGIVKETLVLGALMLSLGWLLSYVYLKRTFIYLLLAIIALLFIWFLKYYVAAVYLSAILPGILYALFPGKIRGWSIGLMIIIAFVGFTFLHPNFNFDRVAGVVYENYLAFHELSENNEAMKYPYEQGNFWFIIINTPVALFTALFMPIMYFNDELPYVLAVTENIFLLTFFVFWIYSRIRGRRTAISNAPYYSIWVYIFMMALFLALSIPNYGSLSRFRVSFLPFFVWFILDGNYLLDKFEGYFPKIRLWIKNR